MLRDVEGVFATYAHAFSRGDPHSIAPYFADTVHVTTDGGTAVRTAFFGSRDEWLGVIVQLLASYCQLGVVRGEIRRLRVTPVSARLGQAAVTWALFGRGETLLREFEALYTLANEGGTWRIVAIAHDEVASFHAPTVRRT